MIRLPGARGRPAPIGVLRRLARALARLGDSARCLADRVEALADETESLRAEVDRNGRRHEQLADQMRANEALGWDYVAIIRRLAALEDCVEALSANAEAASPPAADDPPAAPAGVREQGKSGGNGEVSRAPGRGREGRLPEPEP